MSQAGNPDRANGVAYPRIKGTVMTPPLRLVHKQNAETYIFLGVAMKILLSSADTGGRFSLIEGLMPPGGDGGLHVHANEDESMHLVEGTLNVTIGERQFTLAPGETYFAPRGVPHRLRNPGKTSARGLVVTTPGGFDAFIARAGFPLSADIPPPAASSPSPGQMEQLLALAAEFGIVIVDPPGTQRAR
jgi:mannose-6-phosphate isomerase-like protein (cupin superfamily)